ncbi:MAG: prolyl oligopeptidase family serine peptidase, partial [Planctomycetaceae bacterium]
LWCSTAVLQAAAHGQDSLPALKSISVTSSLDGSQQPVLLWAPPTATTKETPLFVFLHSWSGDYRQNNAKWQREAVKRGWIYLHPNFRGRNDHPEACGSKLARQDVIDAMDHVIKQFAVDVRRIYLAGSSGGGHMTMLMAAYHPHRFSAASAWVGISDLRAWYRFHVDDKGKRGRYAQMIFDSCGGPPGASQHIDRQYRERSPRHHLHQVGDLHLDLNAGVNDGHSGSVPVWHTLTAFNVVAAAGKYPTVSDEEIRQLSVDRRLKSPTAADRVPDPTYGRKLQLRRVANRARVTIFDGGHESLPHAACQWLARQSRLTSDFR